MNINTFLAEEVMEWKIIKDNSGKEYFEGVDFPGMTVFAFVDEFDPTNRIEHAWLVVEAMIKREDVWSFDIVTMSEWDEKWNADVYTEEYQQGIGAFAPTAPEAICAAAVKAIATDKQLKEMGI